MHIYGQNPSLKDPGERIYRLIPKGLDAVKGKNLLPRFFSSWFLKINFRQSCTGDWAMSSFCSVDFSLQLHMLAQWLQQFQPSRSSLVGKKSPSDHFLLSVSLAKRSCVPITKSVFVTVQWSAQVWLCAPPTHCSWNPSRNVKALWGEWLNLK